MSDGPAIGQDATGTGLGQPPGYPSARPPVDPPAGRDLSALVAAAVVLVPVLILVAVAALLGAVVGGLQTGVATLSGTLTFALGGAVGVAGPGFSVAVALPPVLLLLLGARLAARDWGGSGALAAARQAIAGDRFRIDVLLVTAGIWAAVAVLGAAIMPSERLASADPRPFVTALLGVVTILAARAIVRSDLVRRMVRATVRIALVLAVVATVATLLSVGRAFRVYSEVAEAIGFDGPGRLTGFGVTVGGGLLVGLLVLIFAVNLLVLVSAHAIGVPIGFTLPSSALGGLPAPERSILDSIATSPRWIVIVALVLLLLLWIGWTLLPTTDVRGVAIRGGLITVLTWIVALFALPLLSLSFRFRMNVFDVLATLQGFSFREEIDFLVEDVLRWELGLPSAAVGAVTDTIVPSLFALYDRLFTVSFGVGLGAGGSTLGLLVPAIVAALLVMLGSLVRAAAEQPDGRLAPAGLAPRAPGESALRFGARYVGRSLEVVLEAASRRWDATAGARPESAEDVPSTPAGPPLAPPSGPPVP